MICPELLRGARLFSISLLTVAVFTGPAAASDWARFRGPNGSGVSPDERAPPVRWSATENLKWSIDLPGPGSSCPIVVGDQVFVTCWSGYGLSREDPGDQADLRRHLVCVDRSSGDVLWDKIVDPYLPEDEYGGMFAEHGYTSHTPVSDGERVYVFFGKSGVLAFDLEGNELWHTSVGTESGIMNWGTASSPILWENLVVVPATAENHALVALDKLTGSVVWSQEAEGFAGTWGTPVLAGENSDEQEIVLAVPEEVWAFNPETGKLKWYCKGPGGNSATSSAVVEQGIVYALGRREGGTVAIRTGGKGDVSQSHVVWSSNDRGGIGSPLVHENRIYWISNGIANCVDAAAGTEIYKKRLEAGDPSAGEATPGGGRGRGGFRNQSYASPVVAGGKLYFMGRSGDCFVLALGDEFEQLAVNSFGDEADFSATPAISDGELFIRSSKRLYCVAE